MRRTLPALADAPSGGLLARLIQLMDGTAGLQGWRWICALRTHDSADPAQSSSRASSRSSSPSRRSGSCTTTRTPPASSARTSANTSPSACASTPTASRLRRCVPLRDYALTSQDKKFIAHAFKDWKIWVIAVQYFATLFPVYSFSLFSPTLVANLGYTAATAQLLSAPPCAYAAVGPC